MSWCAERWGSVLFLGLPRAYPLYDFPLLLILYHYTLKIFRLFNLKAIP